MSQTVQINAKGAKTLEFAPASKDTIVLNVDVSGSTQVEIPKEIIYVEAEKKDWFDYTVGTVAVLGGLFALIYTILSIKKILNKSEEANQLLNQLVKQNQIAERAIKLKVMPRISVGGGFQNGSGVIQVSVKNEGETCLIKDVKNINNDQVTLGQQTYPIKLNKGDKNSIEFHYSGSDLKGLIFEFEIHYQDLESNKYSLKIERNKGKCKVLEELEL
jgi:hypothetical protein